MSIALPPSPEARLAAAALEAVTWVSARRLRTAPAGQKVCIPAQVMRDLEAALENFAPGAIADWRERNPHSTAEVGTYPSEPA